MTDSVVQKPSHLEWADIVDFSGGVWTVSDWLVPANGFAQMDDCYPQPGGGLRAFAAFTTLTKSGIGANERPVGFYVRGGIPNRTGPTEDSDFYLMTTTSAGTPKLYRMDQTAGATSWTLIKTHAAPAGDGLTNVEFTAYTITGTPNVTHVYYTLQYGGADNGLWRVRYSDGAVTQITTHGAPTNLVTHGDRIVYSSGESNGSRIVWNDPGTETFGASNFLDVLPYLRLTNTSWIKSFVGDLLIAKRGAPFTLLQGDITDPVVRTMSDYAHPILPQMVAETPEGVAYAAWRDGIYVTTEGADPRKISEQIAADDIVGDLLFSEGQLGNLGAMAAVGPWLFTPSGFVYDFRARGWFRVSDWGDGGSEGYGKLMVLDKHVDEWKLYVVTVDAPGVDWDIYQVQPSEGQFTRKRAYTVKTAPLRHASGRQLRIRRVQVYLRSYQNGASCAVTVNGTARSVTGIAAGRQSVRFEFLEAAEVLDVKVVPDSGADGVEAPSIEAVRVASQGGHLTE